MTEHTALSIENVEPESGVDLIKTFTLLGNTIGLVYLSDKTEESVGLFPGEGDMPLESLLIRMKEAGYTGPFSLDIDPKSLSIGSATHVIERIQKAQMYLERYFSR
jgi:sugar phosphate isomerase/epimerase